MEKMCETLLLLRTRYHFNGYIHVKTIPGASDELLAAAGYLADRISVNLELEEGNTSSISGKTVTDATCLCIAELSFLSASAGTA